MVRCEFSGVKLTDGVLDEILHFCVRIMRRIETNPGWRNVRSEDHVDDVFYDVFNELKMVPEVPPPAFPSKVKHELVPELDWWASS